MSTPAEQIADVTASLAALSEQGDVLQRAKMLRDCADAVASLSADMSILYRRATRDVVAEIGASKAARELGLSRGRVYQLLNDE